MNNFIYDGWKSAVHDCIQDAIGDSSTSPIDESSAAPDAILEDDFDKLEDRLIFYLKDCSGLYIIYTRWSLRLIRMWWGRFKYIFRKRSK